MASSLSRKQIDKLGVRLADQSATAEDHRAFAEFVFRHGRALDVAVLQIAEAVGSAPSARVKTRDTMLDKVRRGTRLSTIQDIAGARVVRAMPLTQQDRIVDAVVQRFPGAKIKDRRREPSHGYRAVHIITTVEDCSVEIQIRTALQDLWAELSERLARRVGRAIRYGEAPDRPGLAIGGMAAADRLRVATFLGPHRDRGSRPDRLLRHRGSAGDCGRASAERAGRRPPHARCDPPCDFRSSRCDWRSERLAL